ncbi:MAG: hypothetical protein HZA77_01200 [Candidatus Schekmanbacteria bacterium]|nr:hypothetical protein [Candidatus Schekmanbacteria bacterium]
MKDDSFTLNDGSNIAVIGSGPAGSFFSIFALKMAKLVGKEINITIFEPKDFQKKGPRGCNHCGGVISERLIQMLAVEGINVPPEVVQRGIDSYYFYTNSGDVHIKTPSDEKRIAAVYRGIGPIDTEESIKSFDQFLLDIAIEEGAVHQPVKVDHVICGKKPMLFSKLDKLMEADLVVGAFGVNSVSSAIFESAGFGYKKPETTTASISEFHLGKEKVREYFGSSIHLFLLPIKDIKFAAIIPKVEHVTVCILGREVNKETVQNFLSHPSVKKVLHEEVLTEQSCMCFPKMNVSAAKNPFTDRVVVIGDSGSARLYKDGIGAAYTTGKAAAKTAILYGVGRNDFRKYFSSACKGINTDNLYGKFLFGVTDTLRERLILCEGVMETLRKEQAFNGEPKRLSSILWDMFTGNELYKNIFFNSLHPKMNVRLLSDFATTVWRRLK